ncbi:MAG: hypothetical protein QNJ55_19530 [Xenococcus sp. MO_188.B8]|nr:hypothetical protein [Xenococcus sp. MO_188.B8]
MKAGEIIRIIIFVVIGLGLMFWIQPLIYTGRYIRLRDVVAVDWVADNYSIGAGVVFGFSIFATLLWSFFTAKAQIRGAVDVSRWQVMWWLLGLLPIIGIAIALIFINQSDDALLSLAGFFIFDGLIWLFWLPTATSSPGLFKHIPPGSFMLRRIIG